MSTTREKEQARERKHNRLTAMAIIAERKRDQEKREQDRKQRIKR